MTLLDHFMTPCNYHGGKCHLITEKSEAIISVRNQTLPWREIAKKNRKCQLTGSKGSEKVELCRARTLTEKHLTDLFICLKRLVRVIYMLAICTKMQK